jgi:hypothetical protein
MIELTDMMKGLGSRRDVKFSCKTMISYSLDLMPEAVLGGINRQSPVAERCN